MAQVAFAPHHTAYDGKDSFASLPRLSAAPRIAMVPNPDFSFPSASPSTEEHREEPLPAAVSLPERPQSLYASTGLRPSGGEHRRVKSTLPSFSFNATNSSGLQADASAPIGSTEDAPITPSRRHKRTTSEFVGGDSRFIRANPDANLLTTSTNPISIPGPNRPNHRHRRSAAVSSQDVSDIMNPPEPLPRMSSSAPNFPLELAKSADTVDDDPFISSLDEDAERPPSRRQVEFSDKLEYIPRPLSTISSETGSSGHTIRGHSVDNSISSMLSLSTPSPQNARLLTSTLESTPEIDSRAQIPDSPTTSSKEPRSEEMEQAWLNTSEIPRTLPRPVSEPLTNVFALGAQIEPRRIRPRDFHARPGELDRRRSAPMLLLSRESSATESTNASGRPGSAHRRSLTRKIREWVPRKMWTSSKKHANEDLDISPESLDREEPLRHPVTVSAPVQAPVAEPETDLEAVLGAQASARQVQAPPQPYFFPSSESPQALTRFSPARDESVDESEMIDLDAGLGSFATSAPVGGTHFRRPSALHSRQKHPAPFHRRAGTEPILPSFEYFRKSTPPQPEMENVIEEDVEEEDDEENTPVSLPGHSSSQLVHYEESGIGIQIVDEDSSLGTDAVSPDGQWEPARPGTGYGNFSSRLSTVSIDRRASSIVDEIIFEESSPVEPSPEHSTEIVDAHEEPRAPSFTKSSDGSETPTIIRASDGIDMGSAVNGTLFLTSPDNPETSNFSSPDLACGQSSFETSRLGTSGSSNTGNRTMSSYTTVEHAGDVRKSVDEVPSLTSSTTTMSYMPATSDRREFAKDRLPTRRSSLRTESPAEMRRKRQSIQSLSQLIPFGSRTQTEDDSRPRTANALGTSKAPKKEHRLKKLMFWNRKKRQGSTTLVAQ